jgi:hypothetical protein
MTDLTKITEHMEVVGADGAHVGTVDSVDGTRIKLIKADSGSHAGHHHYVSGGLVAAIEGNKVRLSANADVAVTLEEEKGGEGIADKPGLFSPRNIAIGAAAAVGLAAAGAVISRRMNSGEDGDTPDDGKTTNDNSTRTEAEKA